MSEPHRDFFRYTLRPTFSSRFGIVTFPSVEAMMMVFPDAEGPNSFERSTLIVSVVPSTVISTFFMMVSSPPFRLGEPPTSHRSALNRNVRQITSARLLLIAVRYRKNPRK